MSSKSTFKNVRNSIRARIAVVVFGTVASYVAADQWLGQIGFRRAFDAVAARQAEEAVASALAPIEARTAELDALAAVYAAGSELPPEVLSSLGAEAAVAVAQDGTVIQATYASREAQTRLVASFPNERWLEGHPLLRMATMDAPSSTARGLLEVGDRTILFAARRPARGPRAEQMIFVAEELEEGQLNALLRLAGASGELQVGRRAQLEMRPSPISHTEVRSMDRGTLVARGPILDAIRRPIGTVEVPLETGITELRTSLERSELLSAIGVALLFPLALLLLLQVVVTGPLSAMTKRVQRIARDDDASARLAIQRSDEIGSLGQAFDALLGKLDDSRRASLKAARMSGRADVAVDVAHSAGNALNSISVSSQLARQRLHSVDLGDLRAIHDALEQNRGDLERYLNEDAQGQHLVPFLKSTIDALAENFEGLDEDTRELESYVDGCVEILARLGDSGGSRDRAEVERVSLGALATEAARAVGATAPLITDDTDSMVDPHRVHDILTELLDNAQEATASAGKAPGTVAVQAFREGERIAIVVADHGVGFEPQSSARLFEHDYSSKDGHVGLGLHRSALLAKELGGSLTVSSPGPGLGATAILTLPAAECRVA